ncbi:unnamed protein product, partial [Didymodactylos carnosus]
MSASGSASACDG